LIFLLFSEAAQRQSWKSKLARESVMIGMGNDSFCGCILGNCQTVAEQVPVAASQCCQPKWACGDPLIFEGLRIHPPNPM
jgi:hypothetical protein